jgi:hypothetical protein
MDPGALGRDSSATVGGMDLNAVKHREWGVIVSFICREEIFGEPNWGLVATFVTRIPTTKP